jgi:hypothetical protein
MSTVARAGHRREFAAAWADPRHTRFELPPADINQLLAGRYATGSPLAFTRDMLWDVEVRKAWRPDRYIPGVVRAGSARAWGRRDQTGGSESFYRASAQRLWLRPGEYGQVLEQVRLDHQAQKATFLAAAELPGPDGEPLHADPRQALFHVEHWVGGKPGRPVSRWRIVHLTRQPDPALTRVFARLAASPWLPGYVEIYIREDLHIRLSRQQRRART